MSDLKNKGFGTRSIHNEIHENEYGALTFPIFATSTIVFDDAQQGGRRFALEEGGFIYSRLGNPSTMYLEQKMASLEGCEAALALSSGMGAIGTVFMTALKTGDHVVSDKVIYGCTHALFEHQLHKFGIDVTFVDFTNEAEVKAAIKENTKILYVETPANPTLKIVDLAVVAKIAKEHNLMSVVDNTVATPYLTRPKEYGIDVIVHSATKYLNGHGDVIAGIICGDNDFLTKCRLEGQKDITGSVMSAFDAFLINRGLKTLHVRMDKHSENAMKVAEFLDGHPAVKIVYYPGLKSHANHEIAKKQMGGKYSGLLAFELKGGYDAALNLANSLQVFKLAVSLGDCESLIQHPASMTHSPYSAEDRLAAGIDDGLLRASIGLEDVDDIINDLKVQLDKLV
ncbi:methionine gamma-lyase [Erysipelotrichaceae bacterium OttesenSCG-928-M19]|nr:methionine gamma-lyase [Erysipelotrichaceae bacterium OttesenSCG-928-M19]